MLLDAKEALVPEILALFKNLNTAKLKAAYKCELLIKQFAPKAARRKSDSSAKEKPAAKKVAKKTVKKSVSKKK